MNRPNVFLTVLDSVRPDHLSCYGYSRKTTPNIDEIAQESVLFENAFSTAPWTPPSHASMFTGRYPSEHGVSGKNLYLHKKVLTIAELLRSKGYETLGICINPWVGPQTGLYRGFKRFVTNLSRPYLDKVSFRVPLDWVIFCIKTDIKLVVYNWVYQVRVLKEIERWISNSQRSNKPFFVFVNYFDAHTPYNPPQPFKERFEKIHEHNTNLQKIIDVFNSRHGYPYIAKEHKVSEEEWDTLKSWYNGEVAYIDFFLGKLFDFLKRTRLFDDTLLILTSDHGENFGEHDLANHAFCLYDTLLHVPLIMRYPKYLPQGKKISSIVSHIDVLPTILEVLRIKTKDSHQISGVNLTPVDNRKFHDYIYAEYGPPVADIEVLRRRTPNVKAEVYHRYNRSLKCIRSRKFKYIMGSDGGEELYNLEEDPSETHNIADDFPEKTAELNSFLTARLKPHHIRAGRGAFHPKIKERLQELGYF